MTIHTDKDKDAQPSLEISIFADKSYVRLTEYQKLQAAVAERDRLLKGYQLENWEAGQVLGKALGYPWYKDDPVIFPECTEAEGVCIGEHTTVTIAMEAAQRLAERDTALTIVADIADNLISWKKGDGFSEVKIDSDHVEAMVARLRECADKATIRNEIELMRQEKFEAIQDYNKVVSELAGRDAVIEVAENMLKRAKSLHVISSNGNQGYGLALDEALSAIEKLKGV